MTSTLSAAASTTSTNAWETTYSAYETNANSTAFSALAGTYEINGLVGIPTIVLSTTGLPSTAAQTVSPDYDYYPFYPYQTHQGASYPAFSTVELCMEFVSSSGAVIHRQTLNTGYATGQAIQPLYYDAVASAFSPTGFVWQYAGGGYTSAASSFSPSAASPLNFSVTFPNAGTYSVRYSTRISVRSGVEDDALSDGSRSQTFNTFTKAGVTFSGTLDSNIDLIFPVNFVEVNAGGFQAVTDSTQYVRLIRDDAGQTNPNLVYVKNGSAILQHDDLNQVTLSNFASSALYGKVSLGSDWSSDKTKPATTNILGGIRFQAASITGGSSSAPQRLSDYIADGNTILALRQSSGTNAYFQLPYYMDATYNDAEYDKYETGHFLILWNSDDNTSVQVRGMIQANTTSATNGYTELQGGVTWIIFYQGGSLQAINGTKYNHWVIGGLWDNNWP